MLSAQIANGYGPAKMTNGQKFDDKLIQFTAKYKHLGRKIE